MVLPLPYTDDDIISHLKENGGIVAHTAKMLGCSRNFIYTRIRKSEKLRTELETIQEESDEELLEGSFIALKFNLANLKHSPRVALETAKYVIDYIGHKRKWNKKNNDSIESQNNEMLKKIAETLKISDQTVVEE